MNKINYIYPNRCDAITNIIDSVAQEQSSLADILSVEAEKIGHILTIARHPSEVLEVNKSVQNTISAITKLELILSGKLELFKDCICVGCKEHKQGYSVCNLYVEEETGGRIDKDDDMVSFRYTRGTTDATIKFDTEPETEVTVIGNLPEGFEFMNNKLYIPIEYDWSRSYNMRFKVGEEDTSYEITLVTLV